MGELYENAMAIKDIEDRRALAESARIEAEHNTIMDEAARREKIKRDIELKRKTLSEYKTFVRDTMLQYVIENLMEKAADVENMNEHDVHMMHSFTKQFIHENNGASAILMKAMGRTPIITAIAEAVDDATQDVYDKADKENLDSLKIDKEDIASCLNKLNSREDYQEAKERIAAKVIAAEDEFINTNLQDKAAIDDVIQKAEEKIAVTEVDPDMDRQTKEDIKQEAANIAKRETNYIRSIKPRGIFHEMVNRFSKTVMNSDILKENYLLENGGLDTDHVVASVKCMYSILETFNTIKLEKIDETYITKMLDEM